MSVTPIPRTIALAITTSTLALAVAYVVLCAIQQAAPDCPPGQALVPGRRSGDWIVSSVCVEVAP